MAVNYEETRPALNAYMVRYIDSVEYGQPNLPEPEVERLRRIVGELEKACVRLMYSLDKSRSNRGLTELAGCSKKAEDALRLVANELFTDRFGLLDSKSTPSGKAVISSLVELGQVDELSMYGGANVVCCKKFRLKS